MEDRTEKEQVEENEDDANFSRYMLLGAGGIIALILVIFFIGAGLSVFTDAEKTLPRVGLVRDTLIIIMALEGILIVVALVVLILQVTRLAVMLENESKAIFENAQETVEVAKGTAQFMSENVARPAIDFAAAVSMVFAFVREAADIRRLLRPQEKPKLKEKTDDN